MQKLLIILAFFCLAAGCSKTVETIQENLVVKAMTDGQWRLTKFTQAGNDKTASYAPYRFQFYNNNAVDAINNGTVEKSGTWSANAMAQTMTAQFANAGSLLSLLNGTWKITNNSWTFVEATQTVNNEVFTLRLDK